MLSKIYLIFLFSIILPNVQPQTQSLRTDFPKNRVNITSTSKQKTLSESSTQIKPLPLTLGSSSPINSNQRASLPPVSMTYKEFYEKYKKNSLRVPSQQQMKFRAWIFQQNLRKINQHNANPKRKFDIGVNVFADITEQQFAESYSYNPFNQKVLVADISIDQKLPNINIDWSCKSSRVWDQGDCGCGYLMAAINSIQITMRIHNINVQNLSVQQILSCSVGSSSAGCAGGLAHGVLDYIKEKGIGPDRLYKYEEKSKRQSSKCDNTILDNKNYVNSKVFIKDYKKIRTGDCLQLIQKLKSHAIVAKVSNKLLKFYQNGTIENGPYINFDHYVTVVGYNATDQTFKIQNSWGTQWGNKGFAYLSKNSGICFRAYYPILSQELQNVGPGCK